jgi:hypothetical protein
MVALRHLPEDLTPATHNTLPRPPNATTAEKVPEFLRTARNLTPEQWDKLIDQAKRMAGTNQKRGKPT